MLALGLGEQRIPGPQEVIGPGAQIGEEDSRATHSAGAPQLLHEARHDVIAASVVVSRANEQRAREEEAAAAGTSNRLTGRTQEFRWMSEIEGPTSGVCATVLMGLCPLGSGQFSRRGLLFWAGWPSWRACDNVGCSRAARVWCGASFPCNAGKAGGELLLISAGGISAGVFVCVSVCVDERSWVRTRARVSRARALGGRIGHAERSQMKQQDEQQQAS